MFAHLLATVPGNSSLMKPPKFFSSLRDSHRRSCSCLHGPQAAVSPHRRLKNKFGLLSATHRIVTNLPAPFQGALPHQRPFSRARKPGSIVNSSARTRHRRVVKAGANLVTAATRQTGLPVSLSNITGEFRHPLTNVLRLDVVSMTSRISATVLHFISTSATYDRPQGQHRSHRLTAQSLADPIEAHCLGDASNRSSDSTTFPVYGFTPGELAAG